MVHNQLLELQRMLNKNGILISFSGRFSQQIIEELGDALKKYLESEECPRNDVFNIFSIFIEQTQNIKNYCENKRTTPHYERIANACMVTIGNSEAGTFVWSGNIIEREDCEQLLRLLSDITPLDKLALKKLYKEKLKQELPLGSSSAGIGLVEMARKATQPLQYDITNLDDNFSFFTLKAFV